MIAAFLCIKTKSSSLFFLENKGLMKSQTVSSLIRAIQLKNFKESHVKISLNKKYTLTVSDSLYFIEEDSFRSVDLRGDKFDFKMPNCLEKCTI